MSYERQLDLAGVGHIDCTGAPVDLTQPQSLALCTDVPQFVDCDGDPVVPSTSGGGTFLFSLFSKLSNSGTEHPEFPGSVHVANVTAGPNNGWFIYEVCAPSQPADDSNGHVWEAGAYPGNSSAAGNTIVATGNASPVCVSGGNPIYTLPDCNVANDICLIPVAAIDPTQPTYVFQSDGAGECLRVEQPALNTADCTVTAHSVKGVRSGVEGLYGTSEMRRGSPTLSADGALDPSTDYVVKVDTSGGNIIVTLTTPAACEPSVYHVKKITTDANMITLQPASGNIDNAASYTFGGIIGSSGESRQIFWDGTDWLIL